MLALILAAVVQAQATPSTTQLLTLCDRQPVTEGCWTYLHGFTDAMLAYQKFLERWHVRPLICVPGGLDRERLRVEAIKERRSRRQDEMSDAEATLFVVAKLYPCPPPPAGTGTRLPPGAYP